MRRLVAGAILAASLIAAGTANAGGWATVGLSSLPDGTKAGGTWIVNLTVLQHGRTPLAGVEPTVTIRNQATGKEIVYQAKPTDKTGVYRAEVKFPASGTWTYEIHDGLSQTHTFAPVKIAPSGGDSSFPSWIVVTGGALAVALAAGALLARRLRPAKAAAPAH